MNGSLRSLLCFAFLLIDPLATADVSTAELPVLSGTNIHSLKSTAIGDSFVLYVRLPPEAAADPDRRFPVIYGLDGDHTFPQLTAITTQLGWSGSVPPSIIVGIGYGTLDLNNGNHRSRDLSPQQISGIPKSGGGARFLEFLTQEVFAFIENRYPADPTRRYLFGHSLGGLFSLYAYAMTPESFRGIAAGSPLLAGQLDFLIGIDRKKAGPRPTLFIATGGEEDPSLFLEGLDPLGKHLASRKQTEGTAAIVVLPGFDHFASVTPAMSLGLQKIFTETP